MQSSGNSLALTWVRWKLAIAFERTIVEIIKLSQKQLDLWRANTFVRHLNYLLTWQRTISLDRRFLMLPNTPRVNFEMNRSYRQNCESVNRRKQELRHMLVHSHKDSLEKAINTRCDSIQYSTSHKITQLQMNSENQIHPTASSSIMSFVFLLHAHMLPGRCCCVHPKNIFHCVYSLRSRAKVVWRASEEKPANKARSFSFCSLGSLFIHELFASGDEIKGRNKERFPMCRHISTPSKGQLHAKNENINLKLTAEKNKMLPKQIRNNEQNYWLWRLASLSEALTRSRR